MSFPSLDCVILHTCMCKST